MTGLPGFVGHLITPSFLARTINPVDSVASTRWRTAAAVAYITDGLSLHELWDRVETTEPAAKTGESLIDAVLNTLRERFSREDGRPSPVWIDENTIRSAATAVS